LTFIEGKESDLLSIYATSLLEEAYDYLAKRYQYQPSTPIRVEVYPSHADFSVRTIGLAGLGALGVCFGPVVAIDSPSAREKGEFNWGSTLWHELTHTVTLGVTDNKIPRWFSEGLSVYEERLARPGWGDDVTIPFLMAFKQDKLLPLSELNNGFVRPTYPQQITNSYYQASLICELIERDYGFQAIIDMLAGYKAGKSTEAIFASVLECDPDCFDDKLGDYLEKRFRHAADSLPEPKKDAPAEALTLQELTGRADDEPENFLAQLAMGAMLFREDKLSEAEYYLERAKALFPEYGGKDSPYWYLAQIYKKRGETEKANEMLTELVSINSNHYDAHIELAELKRQMNDERGSAEVLERAMYIYPYEVSTHRQMAESYRGLEDYDKLIRERKALVAIEVADRAQVLYELALAYHQAGDTAGARREVLKALEIAPSFDEALDLLLELQPGESEESS
jgi:tetratricopeptide (TPR) repeat protein